MPLPFEIDEWNTNGISSVWVRVPQLAGTNDFIRADWEIRWRRACPLKHQRHRLVVRPSPGVSLKGSGFPYATAPFDIRHWRNRSTSTPGLVGAAVCSMALPNT